MFYPTLFGFYENCMLFDSSEVVGMRYNIQNTSDCLSKNLNKNKSFRILSGLTPHKVASYTESIYVIQSRTPHELIGVREDKQ